MPNTKIEKHEPFMESTPNDNHVDRNGSSEPLSPSKIEIATPARSPLDDSSKVRRGRRKKLRADSVPSFVPQAQRVAVSSCATLVLSKPKPERVGVVFTSTVSLHIYDLSGGFMNRNSESLTGVHVFGMYHSGIVCYGLEFFFEGGIAITAAGRTRFGKKFETVTIGSTSKSLGEFIAWTRSVGNTKYSLANYHLTDYNCHHFTNSAVEFLTGRTNPVHERLFANVKDLLFSDLGKGVSGIMQRLNRGVQYIVASTQSNRVTERVQAELNVFKCVYSTGIDVRPPVCVVLFRVDSERHSCAALEGIIPYAERLVRHGVIKSPLTTSLKAVALAVGQGIEAVYPKAVEAYVQMIADALMHTPRTLWGPVLNALRIAVLHKSLLAACVFHPMLLGLLASGARDFWGLTLDGKIALLRVLCNFSSASYGATALNSPSFANLWISAAGLAIADYRNSAIVYTGAALALNMAHVIVLTTQPPLDDIFINCGVSRNTPAHNLVTMLLFYLRQWPTSRIPEAAISMLLLALFVLAASCPKAAAAVLINHPIRLSFEDLLNEVKTTESKRLVCLLRSLAVKQ